MSTFDRDKCVEVMERIVNKIKDRVAHPIYHYTRAEGFKGIIESKEIWMTNALFVNDKTELRASFEGGDILKSCKFENQEFNKFKNESRDPEYVGDCYLASFSKKDKKDNSLGQFRAYGNYCIGFDAEKLKKNKFGLFRCVYEEKDIRKWLISKDKLADWQNGYLDGKGEVYKEAAFDMVEFAVSAKSKNKHYEAEQEIRLLVVSNVSWGCSPNCPEMFCDQPAIYFRQHNLFNAPVPYVKFFIPKKAKSLQELDRMVKGKSRIETKQAIRNMEAEQEKELLPINEVIVGPMQHQEEAVSAAKIFLLENGYDKVDVKASDIPFRGS